MSEKAKSVELSEEQLEAMSGGGDDSDDFTMMCPECGKEFTVWSGATLIRCPNCGADFACAVS